MGNLITISFKEDPVIVGKIDEFCKLVGLTRTAFIHLAVRKALTLKPENSKSMKSLKS